MHDSTIAGNVRGTHASSGAGSEPSAVSMISIIRHMTHEVIMFKFESNLDHKGVSWYPYTCSCGMHTCAVCPRRWSIQRRSSPGETGCLEINLACTWVVPLILYDTKTLSGSGYGRSGIGIGRTVPDEYLP